MTRFQNFMNATWAMLSVAVLTTLAPAPTVVGADTPGSSLPALQIIGIIPVQAENAEAARGNAGWDETRKTIDPMFSSVVRSSRRFQTLHDELVKLNWETPSGRLEMVDKYELDGLVSLSIGLRGEDAVLLTRLLGPKMETWLLETETVPRTWISQSPPKDLKESMERLVFRLFNRIPVDVVVTSIQGRFITLSGGEQQGISVSDKVEIMRTQVASTHPVHGSWVTFRQVKLGEARIVDVKTVTAVAQVLSLSFQNAITVGDGAKIPAIAGRAKFARITEEEAKIVAAKTGRQEKKVVQDVTPLFVDKPGEAPQAAVKPTLEPKPGEPLANPSAKPAAAAPPEIKADTAVAQDANRQSPAPVTLPPDKDQSDGSWVPDMNFDFNFNLENMADQFVVNFGPRVWSFTGPASSSAKFPSILINQVGAEMTRPLLGLIKMDIGGALAYGSTESSTYSGYAFLLRPFIAGPANFIPYSRYWKAGAQATAQGLGVASGSFGGGDWVKGGAFGALGGVFSMEGLNLDWEGQLTLEPMTIGRIGYKNKMHLIESSMGWGIDLQAIDIRGPRQIEWGGLIHFGGYSATMDDGKVGSLSDYALQALARYKF